MGSGLVILHPVKCTKDGVRSFNIASSLILLAILLSKRLGKFMFHLILLLIKSQINPCRVEEIMKNESKN